MAITSAYMAKYIVRDIAAYVGPAKDVMSLAKVEISLDAVPEGKNAVFEWRNKPIFVRHRTAAEIAREEGVNVSQLRHPQNDAERVKKPEWLIVIGICTHLGKCLGPERCRTRFSFLCLQVAFRLRMPVISAVTTVRAMALTTMRRDAYAKVRPR